MERALDFMRYSNAFLNTNIVKYKMSPYYQNCIVKKLLISSLVMDNNFLELIGYSMNFLLFVNTTPKLT